MPLQGLRGAAVLLVVVSHAIPISSTSIALGVMGVTMFFALSGFLITGVLATSPTEGVRRLPAFYVARVIRLLPALLVLVLVLAVVWVASGRPLAVYAEYGTTALLYIENFFSAQHDQQILAHTWSLAVEEQFYLLWPLVLALMLRLRTRTAAVVLGAAVLGSIVLRFTLYRLGVGHFAYSGLPSNAYALLLGALPRLVPTVRVVPKSIGRAALVALAVLAAVGGHVPAPTVITPALTALLTVIVISAALRGNRLLSCQPLVFVGSISYAWYLWHWPILWLMGSLHAPLRAAPAVLLSFAVACTSTFLLEDPLRQRYRKVLAARAARPADRAQPRV